MHVAILLNDGRCYNVRDTRAGRIILAGRCTTCGTALAIMAPAADADAVCESCGDVVGRVVVHAGVTKNGTVLRAA